MAGEHPDAILRVDDLIASLPPNSIYYIVQVRPWLVNTRRGRHRHLLQAYMHLLVGDSRMESNDYHGAIESFEHARTQMRHHTSQALLMISLVSVSMSISQRVKIAQFLLTDIWMEIR